MRHGKIKRLVAGLITQRGRPPLVRLTRLVEQGLNFGRGTAATSERVARASEGPTRAEARTGLPQALCLQPPLLCGRETRL